MSQLHRKATAGRYLVAIVLIAVAAMGLGCDGNSYNSNNQVLHNGPQGDDFEASAGRPPTPATLYAMARMLAGQGDDYKSALILARLNADYPEFLPAYCDLAEAQLRHQQYELAANTLRAGLKIAPQDAVLRNNLGMCLLLQGRHEQALQEFQKASTAAPQQARYKANMATALALLGEYEQARAVYQQSVTAADALHNLAILSRVRGDDEAADRFTGELDALIAPGEPLAERPASRSATSSPGQDVRRR